MRFAPDKIYLREFKEDGLSQVWSGIKPTEETIVASPEYIRKDALLEWVKEKQEQMKIEAGGCSNMLAAGKFLAFKELIEKLEKL